MPIFSYYCYIHSLNIITYSGADAIYLNGKHGWCVKVFIWNLQCIDGHPSVLEQVGEDNHVAIHGGLVSQCAVVFVKGDGIYLLSSEHATLEREREREIERDVKLPEGKQLLSHTKKVQKRSSVPAKLSITCTTE